MKIQSIKKSKGLYEIIFNDEIIKYHEEVIIKYGLLRNNIELSDDEYNDSLLDNRYFLCRDRAIKYLINIKFKSQVKEYLLKYEDEFIIDGVVRNLEEYNLVNDYNTANLYILSKYNKGYGSNYLKQKLNDFKVEKQIIIKCIEENIEEEIINLNKYTLKLTKTIKSLNNKDLKRKIEQRLIAHGYKFNDIKNVIEKHISVINETKFDDEVLNKYFEKAVKKYDDKQKIINYLLLKGFEYHKIKEKLGG